jgi:ribosomal protein S18 acetylase RimI-like enzyme
VTWTVRREEDPARVRAVLEADRDWAAYLLADLEPPQVQYARFYLASLAGRDRAVLLVYAPPTFTALATLGEPDGVTAALAAADLPARAFLTLALDHRAAGERVYRAQTWEFMHRMALGPADLRRPSGLNQARRLTLEDCAALEALYAARDSIGFFSAAMLASGVYMGIERDGRLVAAAGTHVVAPSSRIAAIGNVYTAPAARGQGFARITTAAVAAALFDAGCTRVVLNVNAANQPAIGVYRALGFTVSRPFWETSEATRQTTDYS